MCDNSMSVVHATPKHSQQHEVRVARQAIYYTQAGRILGLVADRPTGTGVQLTPYGHAFVRYDFQGQHPSLTPPDAAHRADALGGADAH